LTEKYVNFLNFETKKTEIVETETILKNIKSIRNYIGGK
jgi:hypothetical protein